MPEYEIAVNNPAVPKGDLIEVPPFGRVENGKTLEGVEMTKTDAERYKANPILEVKQTSARKTAADEREEAMESTSTIEDYHYERQEEVEELRESGEPVVGGTPAPEEGGEE